VSFFQFPDISYGLPRQQDKNSVIHKSGETELLEIFIHPIQEGNKSPTNSGNKSAGNENQDMYYPDTNSEIHVTIKYTIPNLDLLEALDINVLPEMQPTIIPGNQCEI
jgi:hypothetical protein